MTLIEVTLVIAVLLALVGVLFIGTSAYKKGSDRATCIQNIASVQKAVRSYGNLAGLGPGGLVTDLKNKIIGPGTLLPGEPQCPASGLYVYGGDALPQAGVAYLTCTESGHEPKSTGGW